MKYEINSSQNSETLVYVATQEGIRRMKSLEIYFLFLSFGNVVNASLYG